MVTRYDVRSAQSKMRQLWLKHAEVIPNNIRHAKNLYRKLAMRLHPDKGGDPAEFRAINEAYEWAQQVDFFNMFDTCCLPPIVLTDELEKLDAVVRGSPGAERRAAGYKRLESLHRLYFQPKYQEQLMYVWTMMGNILHHGYDQMRAEFVVYHERIYRAMNFLMTHALKHECMRTSDHARIRVTPFMNWIMTLECKQDFDGTSPLIEAHRILETMLCPLDSEAWRCLEKAWEDNPRSSSHSTPVIYERGTLVEKCRAAMGADVVSKAEAEAMRAERENILRAEYEEEIKDKSIKMQSIEESLDNARATAEHLVTKVGRLRENRVALEDIIERLEDENKALLEDQLVQQVMLDDIGTLKQEKTALETELKEAQETDVWPSAAGDPDDMALATMMPKMPEERVQILVDHITEVFEYLACLEMSKGYFNLRDALRHAVKLESERRGEVLTFEEVDVAANNRQRGVRKYLESEGCDKVAFGRTRGVGVTFKQLAHVLTKSKHFSFFDEAATEVLAHALVPNCMLQAALVAHMKKHRVSVTPAIVSAVLNLPLPRARAIANALPKLKMVSADTKIQCMKMLHVSKTKKRQCKKRGMYDDDGHVRCGFHHAETRRRRKRRRS